MEKLQMRCRPARVVAATMLLVLTVASGCSALGAPGAAGVGGGSGVDAGGREFGIHGDPWKVDDWADAVGAKPTMIMGFEQWHRNRTLDNHFQEASRQGLRSFMVTWEPWVPVPASRGREAQYVEQPEFSNATIVSGAHDDYIRGFAESVAASDLTVYIRYAHEMNGNWYPWSRDPDNYVRAWRHVVEIFRAAGATNAKFVFSLNPSLYQDPARWQEVTEQYWPGEDYVDLVGSTMISFGGEKDYSVAMLAERIALMRDLFGMDVIITEFNTSFQDRVKWLVDLRNWLETEASWVVGVVLSQAESRAQIQLGEQVGDVSWQVIADRETQPIIKGMLEDVTGVA